MHLLKADDDKRNMFMKIRQAVADNRLNDYSEMYTMLYEKVDEYAKGNVANTILTIADGLSKDALVVDKERGDVFLGFKRYLIAEFSLTKVMWSRQCPSMCRYRGRSPSKTYPAFSATLREAAFSGRKLISMRCSLSSLKPYWVSSSTAWVV